MDTKPTMQVAHATERTAAVPADAPAPEAGNGWNGKNGKKTLVAAAFLLAIAIMVCFSVTIVAEIIYKLNGAPGGIAGADIKYTVENHKSDDIHRGDLILVSAGHEYVFPSDDDIVTIIGNKNSSYIARDSNQKLGRATLERLNAFMIAVNDATGCSDVQVYNGYRSYETQRDDYERYEDEVKAGFSEHHTGTSFDLNVYVSSGSYEKLQARPEVYEYIMANAHKYGFIDRYPDEKKDITGVYHDYTMMNTSRPVHFRYVGYAHAYYMSQNSLCLEEYLDAIRTNYPYEGKHLVFTGDNGNTYEVYYVEADGSSTDVPVPSNFEYTV